MMPGTRVPSTSIGGTLPIERDGTAPFETLAAELLVGLPSWPVPASALPSQQGLHVGVFLTIAVLCGALGGWLLWTRRSRGGRLFAAVALLTALRASVDLAHVALGPLWELLGWLAAIGLLLDLAIALVFLRFAARYVGRFRALRRDATVALAGSWVLAAVLVLTDSLHGLAIERILFLDAPFSHVGLEPGPVGLMVMAVTGLALLYGAVLIVRSFTVTERPSWWAAWLLSIAIAIALAIALLGQLGEGPLSRFNYNGLAVGLLVILAAIPLLSHGLRRIELTARAAVLEEVEDPIVVLDDTGTVVDFNRAALAVFPGLAAGRDLEEWLVEPLAYPERGVERTELSATRIEVPNDESGRDPGSVVSDQSTAAEGGPSDEHSGEHSGAPDESTGGPGPSPDRHFLAQVSVVTAETGETIGYTVRLADVTPLRRQAEELARKNEQLDQFATTVSEDLRDPLGEATDAADVLLRAVEEARTAGADVEGLASTLEHLERSLDRIESIIDDMLALAHSTKPVGEPEPVAFAEIVRAAWSVVDTAEATLSIREDGIVEAHPESLQRILENLFRNAVEHAGTDVSVTASLAADGFWIADDGPGIPADVGNEVFDEDYTTGGTGLGLSIVEELATGHGWTVAVDHDHDGAKFVFSGVATGRDGTDDAPSEPTTVAFDESRAADDSTVEADESGATDDSAVAADEAGATDDSAVAADEADPGDSS